MNRADLVLLRAYADALKAYADNAIKADGRTEWEENSSRLDADVYRDGRKIANVGASLTRDGLEITDSEEFLLWLEQAIPNSTVMIRQARNAEQVRTYLEAIWEAKGIDGKGALPPGVAPKQGGQYLSTSVRLEPAVKKAAERIVRNVPDLPFTTFIEQLKDFIDDEG